MAEINEAAELPETTDVGGSALTHLLCCPFCGAAPEFPDAADVYGTCYEAGCSDCGIATISLQIIDCFYHVRDGCPCSHTRESANASWNRVTLQYGVEYIEIVRNEAIRLWNTRAT